MAKKIKLPKKPKINVSKIKSPEALKRAEQKIADFKKRVAEINRENAKKANAKQAVKKGKERLKHTLSGL